MSQQNLARGSINFFPPVIVVSLKDWLPILSLILGESLIFWASDHLIFLVFWYMSSFLSDCLHLDFVRLCRHDGCLGGHLYFSGTIVPAFAIASVWPWCNRPPFWGILFGTFFHDFFGKDLWKCIHTCIPFACCHGDGIVYISNSFIK